MGSIGCSSNNAELVLKSNVLKETSLVFITPITVDQKSWVDQIGSLSGDGVNRYFRLKFVSGNTHNFSSPCKIQFLIVNPP